MRSLHYYQRHKFQLVIFLFFVFLVAATQSGWLKDGSQTLQQAQPGLYSINHFIDGDTIAVNMNGSVETIRMIGVDTPETHKPNTPVQCYGPQAADFTKNLIGSNSVRLQADPLDTNRDRYGRLLRYVYLPDGRMVETELIKNGYGFAYTLFPFQMKDEFISGMQSAQAAKKGLWSACQVHQETDGAYQTNPANS
jgi:micrococcal nuclease